MGFSDLSDRLDEAVMLHLADTDSATYTPAVGAPATISVILDRDVERTVAGMQGAVMERRTEITAYASDLVDAKREDTISVGAETWRLVVKIVDDGRLVTWVVLPTR